MKNYINSKKNYICKIKNLSDFEATKIVNDVFAKSVNLLVSI